MKLLYRHCKLTTERNRHSQGSGPLGSGPIGTGSGYSVKPGFHMIARIASDARIAENSVLRSLRLNGNCF